MSKNHNRQYRDYTRPNQPVEDKYEVVEEEEIVEETEVVEEEEIEEVAEVAEEPAVVETETEEEPIQSFRAIDVIGKVTDCKNVNVRTKPKKDAPVYKVVPVGTEFIIEVEESTDLFYKVYNASGVYGYIMKDFIEVV